MQFVLSLLALLVAVSAVPVEFYGYVNESLKRDDPFEFRIYSNNVRVSTGNTFPSEKIWTYRKDGVSGSIKKVMNDYPTLIGLQEAKLNQITDIKRALNGNQESTDYPYTHYGVGRDDGKEKGEYAAILYNVDQWELLNSTYKWLSPTPDVPGKAWGACCNRIVSITTLRNKASDFRLNYLNTHLDQLSEEARQNSAKLIVGWINDIPNDYPTFLSGDFNALATDVAYQTVSQVLTDTDTTAYNRYNAGWPTYTGFETTDNQTVVDFVFAPKSPQTAQGKVVVIGHEVMSNNYKDYLFSDHRPVSAHFKVI